ncbi:MAG TPA: glycosyltransferase family 4 protein [Pyrinomonadaceae bacterium]|nr:glycosyltransferase family 4 protein [Pyrinomonadaceae bacterium]
MLTDCPSPYQVELFNEIEARGECELGVAYLRQRDPDRRWKSPEIAHATISLDEAHVRVRDADLVVFNYYRHANAEQLIRERTTRGGPWCFWGERPGFRQPAWAGRLLRKWKLSRLHATTAPIWGIGRFAIDGYRREFGPRRTYFNLPYFSNLKRFGDVERKGPGHDRVFLFSGSLTARKGVDLLGRAFVRLAGEMPNAQLRIVGEGELRERIESTLRRVSERVEFVGFKDWDELPDEYARADVLCVPSRYDGWGLVVPEGLAAGLPVIATDRMGAALEFLETGRNGWLIPAGDEDAILNAMREAASLPLAAMSGNARQSVSSHTLQDGATRFANFAQQSVSSAANV